MENGTSLRWHSSKIEQEQIETLTVHLYSSLNTITLDGFDAKTSFPKAKLKASIQTSDYISVLHDPDGIVPIQGFALVTVPEKVVDGELVLWINKVCISKNYQCKGYGIVEMLQELQRNFETSIGYIGCKTQNPFLLKKLEAMADVCYPFHKSYYSDDENKLGIRLIATAINHVPQLRTSYHATLESYEGMGFVDVPPGILRNEYGASIAPDTNYDSIAHLPTEQFLIQNRFCRENGDCVVIISKLK